MSIMKKVLKQGIIFDGAMGSMLINAGLQGGQTVEEWLLEKPEEISRVHQAYADAGAEVITTATFGGNSIKLEKADLKEKGELINSTAVKLARRVAKDSCFVAGNIGPSGDLMSPAGSLSVEAAKDCFATQAAVLTENGVDFFLIQTFYDLQELLAAVAGAQSVSDLPIFATISFQEKKNGFVTIMGNRVEESLKQLADAGVSVVGANCSIGSSAMVRLAGEMRKAVSIPVMAQPNAGAPSLKSGVAVYNEDPDIFSDNMLRIQALGVEAFGGCCGSTPEYIRSMVKKLR